MRDRRTITKQAEEWPSRSYPTVSLLGLILEVLLDIRQLLKKGAAS